MAWLLVQLKLRLLGNALRSSTGARAGFVLSTGAAGLFAVGTFAMLALLRGTAAPVDLTTVVFTVFAFEWLVLPLIAFGMDGTLDPAMLALYPLRTGSLAQQAVTGPEDPLRTAPGPAAPPVPPVEPRAVHGC